MRARRRRSARLTPPVLRDLREHGVVIGGVGDDGDEFVVLRGGADQGRAADIDILDAGLAVGARRDRRGERVEVADQQVDLADAVRRERREMIGPVAPRQEAAMYRRMQCLDPAVEHFRKAGDLRATSVTGSPASASARAEPPVETSATPRDTSARANGASPCLSLTEISARRIGRGRVVQSAWLPC